MPLQNSSYENGREGKFILEVLIPCINALEERIKSLEERANTPVPVQTPKTTPKRTTSTKKTTGGK